MRHYLVTGAGFIDSYYRKIVKKGNKITIFDNFQRGMLRIESLKNKLI